jgi:type 1 glutamine amidotransferase/sugar phosphate isomerase/epimerase
MSVRQAVTSVAVVLATALMATAQSSSPTVMTTRILRGPDWARLRTAMPDIIAGHYQGGRGQGATSWNAAAPLAGFSAATMFEALDRQQTLFVKNVEAASTQKVSAEIPKNFDQNLTAEELAAVMKKLGGVRIAAYDAPLAGDLANARKVFEFARTLKATAIVSAPPPRALAALDTLANEFGVNVAIENRSRAETPEYAEPKSLLAALNGLSVRIGACVNTANWMDDGIDPVEGVRVLKERVMAIHLMDRSGTGKRGHGVPLGHGALGVERLLDSIYRMGVQPAFLTVEYSGSGDPLADLTKSFDEYDKALQPVAADRVGQLSRTTPIRGPERLSDADRAGIEAAVPAQAMAKPKKPRKLLVIDLNIAYPGHGSIPAANMAVELWGKNTGAYTTVANNDLDNLKYPKIKEFDAIFLNNTVGQIFPDPEIRKSLMRFIREGGGLAAYHGSSHASIDWTEFGDMLGARSGAHRDFHEKAIIKIDDPASPLTAAFAGKEFEWQDEFFRFTTPPYDRDKLHVLLSFDAEKTDMHQKPDCDICDRADNDIAVSWIRSYGKGRIFYATIGHLPTLFGTPAMARFFLSGIQFALGDLDADTTPSGKLTARNGR